MRELEKKQKEDEDTTTNNHTGVNSSGSGPHSLIQHTSSNSNHNNSNIHSAADGVTRRPRENRSYNSRRSSTDSSEDGFNQNVRDLKQELKDMEEKFRKAMVTNASMDNEKSQLMFQVENIF